MARRTVWKNVNKHEKFREINSKYYLVTLQLHSTQCGNLRIFQPFRFYVK